MKFQESKMTEVDMRLNDVVKRCVEDTHNTCTLLMPTKAIMSTHSSHGKSRQY